MNPAVILLFGILFLGCVCSARLSSKFNMPFLLVFLAIGMLMRLLSGQGIVSSLTSVQNSLTWSTANFIGSVALAFILFTGGYSTKLKNLASVQTSGIILATVGVLLTAGCLAVFGYWLLNALLPFPVTFLGCCLLGSIISSTDAAAVFSILRSRSVGLKGQLKPLLELESGSNDPMATFLTITFLELVMQEIGVSPSSSNPYLFLPLQFVLKMSLGLAFGLLGGKVSVWLFNHLNLEHDGLYYVLGMGSVLGTFGLSELCWGNGFLAVYVAGVYMGNSDFTFHNGYGRFSDAIGWLMQVTLFGMLGFLATPSLLWKYKWLGLGMALFLMFVARPVSCFLCLLRSKFTWQEKTLISWVGLRGGAPIMLATFPMMKDMLATNGNTPTSLILFHIIFFMVILSVLIQGNTIMPLAKKLRLDAPLKPAPHPPLFIENLGRHGHADSSDFRNTRPREFSVTAGSDLAGQKIADCKLPSEAFIIMIQRNDAYIIPRGNTVLKPGDNLTILGSQGALEECAVLFQTGESLAV